MKLLRLMALVAFLPTAALAGSPMSTVQPVDGSGVPLGTPTVSADALSSGAGLTASASAVVTARTASTVSGFVNLPVTLAIGGLGVVRAGAGLAVDLIAICQ